MACRAIRAWTLTSLIGSYIDLALAFLLLIGSTLVFFASKFLSLFGLSLPCPCDGLFGRPNCIQTLLVDSPTAKIGSLHNSILTRFPFNSIFNGCGSDKLSLPRPPGLELVSSSDAKGKGGVIGQRAKPVIRRIRRRRVSISGRGKSAPVALSTSKCLSWQEEGISENFCGGGKEKEKEEGSYEESSVGVDSGAGRRLLEDRVSLVDEAATAIECYAVEKDASSGIGDVYISNQKEAIIIKKLERELEEAQAANAALYLELEKERSAAATAADEAMAMILRLQNEKAAVEMEYRQYQRMIEEKFAYDEEEMEILKEIIVRREREKHVLEKEVEAYRQKMLSGEMTGEKPDSSFYSSDDPTLMLKTICESIKKKGRVNEKMKCVDDGAGIHYLGLPDPGEECNLEFQEKGMVTMEVYPSSGQCQSSSFKEDSVTYKLDGSQELGIYKEMSYLTGEDGCERDRKIEIQIPPEVLGGEDGQDGDQRGSDSSHYETELSVLDVHVIDDKHSLDDERIGKGSDVSLIGCASEISGKCDTTDESSGTSIVDLSTKNPVTSWVGLDRDIQRSCSDMTNGSELMNGLCDKDSHFDLRRSSMSAVDRFKPETEVEILRKRLKIIQQGREKLSFPVEYREKETFQLQLLEEIACQLQEVRKITEPGKSVRQSSLPPQSSKVSSKKRRCRSVSFGLHESA